MFPTKFGLAPDSQIGARQAECGFDNWCRDDGLWGYGPDGFYDEKRSPYNEFLKSKKDIFWNGEVPRRYKSLVGGFLLPLD